MKHYLVWGEPRVIIGAALTFLGLTVAAIVGSGAAHADMCGPSGLPVLGQLNPYVKSCNIWVPFVPGVKFPVVMPPANAPYPVWGVGGAGGWLGQQQPGSVYNPLPYNPPLP